MDHHIVEPCRLGGRQTSWLIMIIGAHFQEAKSARFVPPYIVHIISYFAGMGGIVWKGYMRTRTDVDDQGYARIKDDATLHYEYFSINIPHLPGKLGFWQETTKVEVDNDDHEIAFSEAEIRSCRVDASDPFFGCNSDVSTRANPSVLLPPVQKRAPYLVSPPSFCLEVFESACPSDFNHVAFLFDSS